jgi:3-methyladenine DNA glycosylase AlkD
MSPRLSSRPTQAANPAAREVLAKLERLGTKTTRDGMARYGIVAPKSFGVGMAAMKQVARGLGQDHALALELWDTGWYEARMLAALIAEPERLTPEEMERWCRDFDTWSLVDTACFYLFDRSPHAWRKIVPWSRRKDEFVRRAGFVLLACLALHDKSASDAAFERHLPLIEKSAKDDCNFVKKAVSWSLHAIGTRTRELNQAAMAVARRLSQSTDSAERWVGKDALRKLSSDATGKRFAQKSRRSR